MVGWDSSSVCLPTAYLAAYSPCVDPGNTSNGCQATGVWFTSELSHHIACTCTDSALNALSRVAKSSPCAMLVSNSFT